jgi:hypothetical protein
MVENWIAQDLTDAAVQDLASASEQILVGSVLDQRMLKTIIRGGTSRVSASASRSNAACNGESSIPATEISSA